MDAYKEAIASNKRIVIISAPARAGKSEAVLGNVEDLSSSGGWKSIAKKFEGFLKSRYIGLGKFKQSGDAVRFPEELINGGVEIGEEDSGKTIVVLDEFNPEMEAESALLKELIKDESVDKIVICAGGNSSNRKKKKQVFDLGEEYGFSESDCALVEFGLKPLNKTQLRKLFELELKAKLDSGRGRITEEDGWERFEAVYSYIDSMPPILPIYAGAFINRLLLRSFDLDRSLPNIRSDIEMVRKNSTNIISPEELGKIIKKRAEDKVQRERDVFGDLLED